MAKRMRVSPEQVERAERAKKYAKLWTAFEKALDAWNDAGCPEGPLCEAWEKAWDDLHR